MSWFCYSAAMSQTETDRERAIRLLEIYRGGSDDFFKVWPPDKTYYFSSDNKAFIAYAVRYRTAVCIGDPVGADDSIALIVAEFREYCRKIRLRPLFVQASADRKGAYRGSGFKPICIGADAIVDLDEFMERTIRNRYFRNFVNRFTKMGYSLDEFAPPHSTALLRELRHVSDSWLTIPHRKEWSFITGRFDTDYLQQVNIIVLRDKKGSIQAFVNELTSFQPGTTTIDMMRHRRDAPTNSIDLLFTVLFQRRYADGYSSFNLGISPLDGKEFKRNVASKMLDRAFYHSNRFIGFRGLHQFKAKYHPKWEPRYVWYSGNPTRLALSGVAVARLIGLNVSGK